MRGNYFLKFSLLFLLLFLFSASPRPVIAATVSWDQSNFWFRDDDGSEATATGWGTSNVAKNTAITNVATSTAFRLRFGINASIANGSIAPRIEYAAGSSCTSGTWTAITPTSALFNLRPSSFFNDGDPTTQQITNGQFVVGKILESTNPAATGGDFLLCDVGI